MPYPKPTERPRNPCFSCGPCAKRPGWTPQALAGAALGRSHRSRAGHEKLAQAIAETRELLRVPADYRLAILPASDTGAMELAMWSLLGPLPVDVLAFESFSNGWAYDISGELRLDARVFAAPFGELSDLSRIDPDHDLVFAWNGTTSGVRVPNADFISNRRRGLTLCDATSAAFMQPLDFAKLDATTFSWQKALGGEAGFGMLILSPRAIERLRTHRPAWPMPKIFRLTKDGALIDQLFEGATINTPSLLCVEDFLDALAWARSVGGLDGLRRRVAANAAVVARWVETSRAFTFLAKDPATRSDTSVCLEFADPHMAKAPREERAALAAEIVARLETECAGHDVGAYRDAPPGLRLWSGPTVEAADLALLTGWIDWAYAQAVEALGRAREAPASARGLTPRRYGA